MTVNPAFEAAVRADPDDDTVRLVYADWLDENGGPDRAEFIRAQIAHACAPACWELFATCDGRGFYGTDLACPACAARHDLERRVDHLGLLNWRSWVGHLLPGDPAVRDRAGYAAGTVLFPEAADAFFRRRLAWRFDRGFVGAVGGPWRYVAAQLDVLLEAFPVTRVRVYEPRSDELPPFSVLSERWPRIPADNWTFNA